jgi:hypothetical protein
MLYNLTEEQSTEMYNDLVQAIALVDEIGDSAVIILNKWYESYTQNAKRWFGLKPYSFEKFTKKIVWGKGIEIHSDDDSMKIIGTDNFYFTVRYKKVMKLTKITNSKEIVSDSFVLYAAQSASVTDYNQKSKWVKMLTNIDAYMKVPYTIDDDWIETMKTVRATIIYYRYVLGKDNDTENSDA